MNNKVLVKLIVPAVEQQYDMWLPLNKQIYNIIKLLIMAVKDLTDGYYNPSKMPTLYDKLTAKPFDINLTIKEASIKNGSEIILI